MEELISKTDALASIKALYPNTPPIIDIFGARRKWLEKYAPYFECENAIEQLQPVKQETVTKIGHWICHEEAFNALGMTIKGGVKCSECGFTTHNRLHMEIGCPFKYCPNCGVRMIDPKEEGEKL